MVAKQFAERGSLMAMQALMRRSILAGLAAIVVAACGTTPTSPSPTTSPVSPSSAPSAATSPSAAASATAAPATAKPATPAPTATAAPAASASAAAACAVKPQTGQLRSDRLIDVVTSTADGKDVVTFVFGDPSIGNPAGTPTGDFTAIKPPYTQAASGLPIEMQGEHVVQVRFDHMSLQNDAGQPTYDGDLEFHPDLRALKDVVDYDMSEGVVGWLIGWDGNGCATLVTRGRNVTVSIEHPAG